MKKKLLVLFTFLCFTGICVGSIRTIIELKEAQETISKYEVQITELRAEVEDLNELIETLTETNDQLRSDLANTIEDSAIDALKAQVEELKYNQEVNQDILHSDYIFNQKDLDEVFEYYENCICNENLTVNEAHKLEILYTEYYDSCVDCLERGNDKLALSIAYEFMECAINNVENCTLGDDHTGMFDDHSAEFIRVLEIATR